MMCEECKERQATVHFTQVVNGEKTEKHLCEHCARQAGDMDLLGFAGGGFNINNLLAGFMNLEQFASAPRQKGETCPTCGADYRRFAEGGRLGCANCYQTFSKQLAPVLKRIHGTAAHQGKVPKKGAKEINRKRQITRLKGELKQAVDQEQYERAAEIRDKIRLLDAE